VYLNNCALGSRRGRARLFYDRPASGLASLTRRNLDHLGLAFSESEEVDVDTVDHYCSARRVEYIDLLKLDIEGHELDALHGAAGMVGSGRVGLVTFEFGGCNIDTRTYFRDFL
jgi:FkbM family methyltransferase